MNTEFILAKSCKEALIKQFLSVLSIPHVNDIGCLTKTFSSLKTLNDLFLIEIAIFSFVHQFHCHFGLYQSSVDSSLLF